MAETQHKEIKAFGWRVREKISKSIEIMKKVKLTQNMSNKEKTTLKNLIHAKSTKIVRNDTDKTWGLPTWIKVM